MLSILRLPFKLRAEVMICNEETTAFERNYLIEDLNLLLVICMGRLVVT